MLLEGSRAVCSEKQGLGEQDAGGGRGNGEGGLPVLVLSDFLQSLSILLTLSSAVSNLPFHGGFICVSACLPPAWANPSCHFLWLL